MCALCRVHVPLPRVLAGVATVCEQGQPNPVGSGGGIGRKLQFCYLIGEKKDAVGHKELMVASQHM